MAQQEHAGAHTTAADVSHLPGLPVFWGPTLLGTSAPLACMHVFSAVLPSGCCAFVMQYPCHDTFTDMHVPTPCVSCPALSCSIIAANGFGTPVVLDSLAAADRTTCMRVC
jgi:hypothetical protein